MRPQALILKSVISFERAPVAIGLDLSLTPFLSTFSKKKTKIKNKKGRNTQKTRWYLDEGSESRVFLLLGLDDLQGEGLVAAEGAHRLLDLLLLAAAELEAAHRLVASEMSCSLTILRRASRKRGGA